MNRLDRRFVWYAVIAICLVIAATDTRAHGLDGIPLDVQSMRHCVATEPVRVYDAQSRRHITVERCRLWQVERADSYNDTYKRASNPREFLEGVDTTLGVVEHAIRIRQQLEWVRRDW